MKLKHYAFCVVGILLLTFIICGFNFYLKHTFILNVEPNIKNVTIRLTDELHEMNDKGSNITYKECFEKLEQDIKEDDKNTIEIQSLETGRYPEETKAAIDYIDACKKLSRCLLAESRSQFKLSISLEYAKRMTAELAATPAHEFKSALHVAEQAIAELHKEKEEDDKATDDIFVAAKNVALARTRASKYFSSAVLVKDDTIERILKSSNPAERKPKP